MLISFLPLDTDRTQHEQAEFSIKREPSLELQKDQPEPQFDVDNAPLTEPRKFALWPPNAELLLGAYKAASASSFNIPTALKSSKGKLTLKYVLHVP